MTVMPDFAFRATFDEALTEEVDERLLDLRPGTVVVHPLEGYTAVAVPVTLGDIHAAARSLYGWSGTLRNIAGKEPVALSTDPLED